MGIYYIKTADNSYYELDSTSEINVSMPGRATDFPLEDGESASDHYINENVTIRFDGVVSDVKTVSNKGRIGNDPTNKLKGTVDYIKGLEATKKSKQPFTVYYSPNLDPIDNCVFEALDIKQDSKYGSRGDCSSYRISFTAKQLRFGESAQSVSLPASDIQKNISDKSTTSGSTQQLTQQEEDVVTSDIIEADDIKKAKAEARKEQQLLIQANR